MNEPGELKPSKVLIQAQNLGVYRAGRWLVRGVDLAVRRGEIVTLIGPNGSGKTTTARAILGLIKQSEGVVTRPKKLKIGYVPQRFQLDWTLPLTVRRLMTLTARHDEPAISNALEAVGIAHLATADHRHLSGGEMQRALIARALLRQPDLLVLDEPVQGVDFSGEIALYELIVNLRDELGCGVLMISHDLHIVMAQTDTVICLNGHVCCSGTPQSVATSAEYQNLFGPRAAQALALYHHDHDHEHGADGHIVTAGDGHTHDHAHPHLHTAGEGHDHAG